MEQWCEQIDSYYQMNKPEQCIDFVKDDSTKVAMITSLKDAFYLDKKNIGTKIIKGGEKNE